VNGLYVGQVKNIIGMKKNLCLLIMILGFVFFQGLTAQTANPEITEIVKQILQSRTISNELAIKYTWTSRTEILKSKEILNIMIEKNQYDQKGQLIQKVLNEQGAKMPTSFLIKEIAESEKENMEKFLFGLRDFLKKYSLQQSEQVQHFISGATWKVIDSIQEFVFTGKNIEEEGDQLIWTVDGQTFSTSRIEVNTIFEKEPIKFSASFNRLKNGLNYLTYAEAIIPEKNITLLIHNYDYLLE
jgi:hypothetical protein